MKWEVRSESRGRALDSKVARIKIAKERTRSFRVEVSEERLVVDLEDISFQIEV